MQNAPFGKYHSRPVASARRLQAKLGRGADARSKRDDIIELFTLAGSMGFTLPYKPSNKYAQKFPPDKVIPLWLIGEGGGVSPVGHENVLLLE